MDRGWRVIDCSSLEGSLSASRGRLLVKSAEREASSLPVEDIAVVLVGPKVHLSVAALHRLATSDVAVLVCDWRGVPYCALNSWGEHSRVGARARAQANLSVPRTKNAWSRIVKAKVRGQAANLAILGLGGEKLLLSLAKEVKSGDVGNVEGRAARIYWQQMFGRDFIRDRDLAGINACLNYGYAVLRGHGIRAVASAGLLPALGIFHRGRSNAFNLVDDLIEPFRPAIDYAVSLLPEDANPSDSEVKKSLVGAADQPFTEGGFRLSTVFEDFAQGLGCYVEGEGTYLKVPQWHGPVVSE
ncbi:type II CRISPR-associated endonuclease Cas1 [Actinomycetaceae bacterium TAE3-ERU4]|nr:type II CRISPR-associated endonuclease Cas1 [Actinomycetaceae bacterium TAE3-ERU4]